MYETWKHNQNTEMQVKIFLKLSFVMKSGKNKILINDMALIALLETANTYVD